MILPLGDRVRLAVPQSLRPYKAGDLIAQDVWYRNGVYNVGLVISDEHDDTVMVLWREPDKYNGSKLLWTLLVDRSKCEWDAARTPRVLATSTYLLHRLR